MNTINNLIKIEKETKTKLKQMATHSISKFILTKQIHKEQHKLIKQQLNDSNHKESQNNNSEQNNLTQQCQYLNTQIQNLNSVFDEIKESKIFKYNQYCTHLTQNLDQSLTTILNKLSIQNKNKIKKKIQFERIPTQPFKNTYEGTIKTDFQF